MSSPCPLRTDQAQIVAIVHAIAGGRAPDVTDILVAVTPGCGKSLLPVIAAQRLLAADVVERVCWVVPRAGALPADVRAQCAGDGGDDL